MPLPTPHKAMRTKSKASIVIEGLAGTGKTGLALLIAKTLSPKGYDGLFFVDTENKSADLYEGIPMSDGEKCLPFTKVDLTGEDGYQPSNFLQLREMAIKDGYDVFVQDSTSHAWVGRAGVLELVAKLEEENSKLNKFNAWGNAVVMSEKNGLADMLRDPSIHVISTVRLKEKFDLVPGEGVKSRGEAQIMQADMKFEPDLLLRMVKPGGSDTPPVVKVMKTRYAFARLGQEYEVTPEWLTQLKLYLDEGADPAELLAAQRESMITSVGDLLKANPLGKTKWTMFLTQNKLDKDTKLAALTDLQLNSLYKTLQM